MEDTFYFCMNLTENEHYVVESDFDKKCKELGMALVYYRVLKDGHVPMFREVKVQGTKRGIKTFKTFLVKERYTNHMQSNPHKNKYKISFPVAYCVGCDGAGCEDCDNAGIMERERTC